MRCAYRRQCMMRSDRLGWMSAALLLALLGAFIAALALRDEIAPSSFNAFYCAGVAIDRGADPYLVEPLRSCEHAFAYVRLPSDAVDVVEPAPLPGYALAGMAILGRMPYNVAHATYLLIMLAALAATGLAVSRIAALPPLLATLPFVSLWFRNLAFGELPPVAATAGIALCAWALYRGRSWLAAAAAAMVAVEPHVALPLWIALAASRASLRLPLAVMGAPLLALDIAIGGAGQALEYFVRALPAQAASEIHAADQFSLTHMLALAGVGDTTALQIGGLSYLLMIAAGVLVGHRLATGAGFAPYLALVAPAFALLGGTYVHDLQFIVALPLAVTVLARKSTWWRATAALLLCIPWTASASRLGMFLTLAAVCGVVALAARGHRLIAGAMAASLVTTFAILVYFTPPPRASAVFQRHLPGTALAAQEWREDVEAAPRNHGNSFASSRRKLPIWLGSAMLLALCCSAAYSRPQASRRDLGRRHIDQRLSRTESKRSTVRSSRL